MTDPYNLHRFIDAQEGVYERALAEIQNGRKRSHWMWFIFPQLKDIGYSETSKFYGIANLDEATLYLENEILKHRLIEISTAVLSVHGKTANEIFGSPDDAKLRSCMTLFSLTANTDDVFEAVLTAYFNGQKDPKTLRILNV
ncbi:DUF1810 family protein [Rudanella paleaurantiibacter]|uniref:DUF1810 family protein n=1 Tax=Rudanella paleaurantiibacter TaxID=2614655 RepID=A0A7J5TUW1_9BACT|nr:DUF1810 domain-containing protein [Rudanella paleaurantiibacter]KAB7727934.1 DUF1810 family protein [Rudanella paleaurantiibacter]